MKKQILFLFAVLASSILLLSCGSSSNNRNNSSNEVTKEKGIIGKWILADITHDIRTSDSITSERIEAMFGTYWYDETSNNNSLNFTDDKNFVDGKNNRGTYLISADELTLTSKSGSQSNKFKLNGDTLRLLGNSTELFDDDEIKELYEFPKGVKIEKVAYTITLIREK